MARRRKSPTKSRTRRGANGATIGDLSLTGGAPRGLKRGSGVIAPIPRGQTAQPPERFAPVVGRPPTTKLQQVFPRVLKPVYRRQSIKTLIKVDASKGITQPEEASLPGAAGTLVPGAGGFKGATILREQPQVPPPSGKNRRVIPAPSPTNSAGVRTPFNQAKRAPGSRRGNNKRLGG